MLRLIKISDSILKIESKFRTISMNNYLLKGKNLNILVDTGFIVTNKELVRFFNENNLEFNNIDLILNTHCHLDHSGKNKFFKSMTNARILIHEADKPAVETVEGLNKQVGSFVDTHKEIWNQRVRWWNYEEGCKTDGTIKDNQVFKLGNHTLRVLHTPGHTLGHCSFLFDDDILIAGDMGFEMTWYANARASLTGLINSYKRLLNLDLKLILSGHLEPVTEDIKTRYAKKLKELENRDIRILNLIKNGYNTLEKLIEQRPTLKNRSNNLADRLWQDYGEGNQILQHIEKLKKEKKIKETGNSQNFVKWEIN